MSKELIFKLNNRCNANCIFCELSFSSKKKEPELKKKISEFKKKVSSDTETIVLTGGEPGIYPYLFEFLKFINENYNFKNIYIQSNGLIYSDEKLIKKMIEHGITDFQLSFNQYNDEKYSTILGIKNPLKIITKGIDNIQKFKKNIVVNIVINKFNYLDIDKIINILINKNIKNILISSHNPIGSNINLKKISLASIKFSKVIEPLEKTLDILKKNKIDIILRDFPICLFSEKWRNDEYFRISKKMDKDLSFKKLKICKKCEYKNCLGIRKSYLKIFKTKEFE